MSAPDRPRLRALDAFPIVENGQRYLGLRDPSGMTDSVARLPAAAVAVLQLCDGRSTRDEICAAFERKHQSTLERAVLDRLLDQLDQALLLDSPRFRAHRQGLYDDFARSPVRTAYLAGRSYPAESATLSQLLGSYFDAHDGPGRPGPATGRLPAGVLAPHIDFHRGGPAYAWAYRPLAEAAEVPELVIIFGTDHNGAHHPFTLTRKHYDTPLGRLDTDVALVDALTAAVEDRLGAPAGLRLFEDEHHHRAEHSIEFQMVWLRHVWGTRADRVRVLPVLCGSLHHLVETGRFPSEEALVTVFLEALAQLTAGRSTLLVAGADLAHVGPRFGDAQPLAEADRQTLHARDHATLAHCARADAAGWFAEIAAEQDRRRVCGLPPVYAFLQSLRGEPRGRLAFYGQCAADEDGGSLVSIASVVYDAANP